MADTEELSVVIEPDAEEVKTDVVVEKERNEKGQFKAKDPAVDDLKAQFDELKERSEKEKDDERARREAAERRAAQATQEARRARQEVEYAKTAIVESQVDTVTQGLAAAQAEAESATQEYASAMEAGDWTRAGKAQRRIANAEAKIVRLDEAKSNIEASREQRQQRVEPQQPDDPVEAYIQGRTEPTAKWLRDHREWIGDPKKNQKLTAAHHDAVSEGYAPDTQDYFDHVEKFIGLKKAEAKPEPKTESKRKSSAPVAPVSGSGGGISGNASNEVRLTAAEARAATDGTHVWGKHDLAAGRIKESSQVGTPIGIQELARRKLAMQKEGWYDKTYLEQ